MSVRPCRLLAALLLAAAPAAVGAAPDLILERFDDLAGWSAMAAQGVSVELAQDAGWHDGALRIDFDFQRTRGWVIARKQLDVALPPNYAFRFWLRGDTPPNNLEFKIVDPDGNVWWYDELDFTFPDEWQRMTIRKSRLRFAWGPGGEVPLERVAYVEFAISTGAGGIGSVWLDELTIDEREPDSPESLVPAVTASTWLPGHEPALAADGAIGTAWHSGAIAAEQWLLLDLGRSRDFGGLVIDWHPDDYPTGYAIAVSDDGEAWRGVASSASGTGGRDYVYLPETEARFVRLTLQASNREQGYGVAEIVVKPIAFAASITRFFKEIARESPPGTFPRYLLGEQSYWTVVGVAGDAREALLNEEGMVEVGGRAFSIEPFLYTGGALVTWRDVERTPALARGFLPMPSVTWRHPPLELRIGAFAAGAPGASTLYLDYTVTNAGPATEDVTLFLALRPFQVLPPWQSLYVRGGLTPIRALDLEPPTVWVNGEHAVVALTPPERFGAAPFEQGLVTKLLPSGHLPATTGVEDPFGYAEGALEYRLGIEPGGERVVRLAVPFHDARAASARIAAAGIEAVAPLREATAEAWARALGRVELELPEAAGPLVDILKTTLAYVLINQDGPALQPGSRTYGRSWIRDGAFTATALLQMGFTEEARAFLTWFAGYQLADGRIPCCVDGRGADLVPEHDSNGEFVYAVAEYYRHTRDVGFLYAMWPAVRGAVESIAALRAGHAAVARDEIFRGLLPPSISHEGYSSHPVHSYWDDFLALRGLRDAAALAPLVGDDALAVLAARERDELRHDVYASISAVMARRGLDYIPASADLGDFDPNSTAVAIVPGAELPYLPRPALDRTFDRYLEILRARVRGEWPGEAYTPYELRNVDAFVRLGEREKAYEVLRALVADRRPPAWNEWQEIVWRDPTAPRFIGDMPHTWAASAFVRALRTMLVYEREADEALVIAAGVPAEWMATGARIVARRLPTHHGVLGYTLTAEREDALRIVLDGDLDVPPGGLILRPPLPHALRAVTVNGEPVPTHQPDGVTVHAFPADVLLEY